MDIDRYIAHNEPTWARLEHLTRRASPGVKHLEADELDELVQLYQLTSVHLSFVRTYLKEPVLIARLTQVLATANGLIYGRRARSMSTARRFFTLTFPGAVYHCRRFVLIATVALFLPAAALGLWLTVDPNALEISASPQERRAYVDDAFEQYYSESSPLAFFTQVTTNNIRVSFMAYAAGAVSGGLGAALMLAVNGAPLGIIGAWMYAQGDLARFLGFIIPHGALELSAIVIAGGAGMAAGWALISPGDRTRGAALREEGQRSATVIIGLMTMFLAAGIVEGFITGRGLPAAVRVAIGVLLWLAYLSYLVVQGRAAADQGITGLLGEKPRTWDDEPDRWLPSGAIAQHAAEDLARR
jgi:uncharacterized membrane protein SpoIIM required for sporulation